MAGHSTARKLPTWMTRNVSDVEEETKSQRNISFRGIIKYCSNVDDLGLACESLISEADREDELIVGFDAEWPVDFTQGSGKIALIQVCIDESTCYLFHVSLMRSLPKIFINFIEHPKVKLVGNCIKNDIWKIGRDFNLPVSKLVSSHRVIDLGEFANQVLHCAQTWSLDRLALHLMSMTVDKADSIRKSRWDLELSREQQLYAATDAYVSLAIYNKLRAKQSQVA
ncbi:Werner Syndrome-like exonuclease isoform X2 [Thrips palmi]|uniref:3'-5' exonuclease n=1 Tax=Thrips palmi TaxID=161013 RepID=A0A6P8YDD5_THRPL|nr:Werner Syndrome-like exonuclease isoform X2 [Thrips palmi]